MAVRTLETARNDAAAKGYKIEVSPDGGVWTVRCKSCNWAICGGLASAVANFLDLLERCSCRKPN